MSYASATITSSTPAKDLMAALGPVLTGAGYTFVESYSTVSPASWSSVAYGNGTYVAVATGTATAATSTDGITWTPRTLPASASWTAVTYGNNGFVAVSSSTIAATSPDGITWTQRALPAGANMVAYGGGVYVAIQNGSTAAASSPDGITWTARTMPSPSPWAAVAYGGGKFAAVATGTSAAASSTDGITWTLRTNASNLGWQSVAYGNGKFVAVATNSSSTAYSTDGVGWSSGNAGAAAANGLSAITYGATAGFLAVQGTGSGSAIAVTSADGLTWTQRTLPAVGVWLSVAASGSGFAAVSQSMALSAAGSADGATWTRGLMAATSTGSTADVYRSPAANNSFGHDWYLILRRSADTNVNLWYQVAEAYDATNHLISNYGGTSIYVSPVPGTGANPMGPMPPDIQFGQSAFIALQPAAFTWRASVTGDRFVLGVKLTASEQGFYAGLYDDLLPAGLVGFPLVCAQLPQAQSQPWCMGFTGPIQAGGFTREPFVAANPNTAMFDAKIHNAYVQGVGAVPGNNYTPSTSSAALYGNPNSLARAMIGSSRGSTTGDALRGLLKDVFTSQVSSAAGDTATVGAKTYVRLAGPIATFGFFVDQAL